MSFLITSNLQDEYSSVDRNDKSIRVNHGTPIQNPASYSNHLVNPLRIPPNSEIAVQSIKINRKKLWEIGEGALFYFYNGLKLEDDKGVATTAIRDSLNAPVPVILKPGTYTTSQMQAELSRALNEAITHPTWWNQCVVKLKGALASRADWNGYEFNFGCHTKHTSQSKAGHLANWRGWDSLTSEEGGTHADPGGKDFSVDIAGSLCTIRRKKDTGKEPGESGYVDAPWTSRNCSITNTDIPMDLTGAGMIQIDLFKTNDHTAGHGVKGENPCGFSFSRPKLYNENMSFFANQGTESDSAWDVVSAFDRVPYADYRVDWNQPFGKGTPCLLTIHQAVWDVKTGGTIMKEIEYWKAMPGGDGGGANPVKTQIDGTALSSDPATKPGYTGLFKVEFKGSGIKVSMEYMVSVMGSVGTSWKIVCDTTASANRALPEYCFTPINQNKEALYAGLSLYTDEHQVLITHLAADTALAPGGNHPYGYGTEDTLSDGTKVPKGDGNSYWSRCRWGEKGGGNKLFNMMQAMLIENRPNQRQLTGTTINWEDLDASSQCPAKTKVLVLSDPDNETTSTFTKGQYYPAPGANFGAQLGFPAFSQVSSNTHPTTFKQDGTTPQANESAVWVLNSAKNPIHKTHSAFVRVPSLTMESYNFCKSKPSQIIYHIPRWSDNGAGDGEEGDEQFVEPGAPTYIKLKNVDWINLNRFQVDIVDKNERIVEDLAGTTTVCFHIRHQSER